MSTEETLDEYKKRVRLTLFRASSRYQSEHAKAVEMGDYLAAHEAQIAGQAVREVLVALVESTIASGGAAKAGEGE